MVRSSKSSFISPKQVSSVDNLRTLLGFSIALAAYTNYFNSTRVITPSVSLSFCLKEVEAFPRYPFDGFHAHSVSLSSCRKTRYAFTVWTKTVQSGQNIEVVIP